MKFISAVFSSFTYKIILFIVLFFLCILTGIHIYSSQILQSSIREEYESYASNIEIFLQNSLLPLLITNDLDGIEAIVDAVTQLEVIHRLRVYSYDDLIFQVDKRPDSAEAMAKPLAEEHFFHSTVDFKVADEAIGRVAFSLFLGNRLDRIESQKQRLLLISLLAALLFTAVIVFFLRAITRKVKRLEQASKEITHNVIPDFLPIDGRDEISRTTQAFNEMLWQLREKYVALDLSPDGILIVSISGHVTYFNPALRRILGDGVDECLDKPLSEIDQLFRQRLNLAESDIGGLTHGFTEAQLVFGKQEKIIVRCHKERYASLEGSEFSTLFYFLDVTHETEVERLKSDFLNTAAHELRTPLASILGGSELLLNFDYEPKQVQQLSGSIHRQSMQLKSIIDDLLDIARIEARTPVYLDLKNDNLSLLLEECCTQARNLAPDKKIDLLASYPVKIMAVFDRDKLRRAILNLLSNAVKYSDVHALVELFYTEPRRETPWHTITIRDQGIGMTEEQLSHLGEKFYRADDSGKILGTGLGVSISKQIVTLHGGELDYQSEPGVGTSVALKLPLQPLG